VAVCVRKRATVSVYLCDQHDRRRKWFVIGGSVGAVLGFVAFIAGCATSVTWLIVLGLVVFLLSIIGLVRGASLVRATRIKDDTVWLKGAGPEFLASLPPWT
jgi:hypothetical protein